MSNSTDFGRSVVVDELKRELFGPWQPANPETAKGEPLVLEPPVSFETKADAYGPFHEAETGEEILVRDRPTKRYGVGVLYPRESLLTDGNDEDSAVTEEAVPTLSDEPDRPAPPDLALSGAAGVGEPMDDDFDLSTTSQYRPSAMAVSFLVDCEDADEVVVDLTGGRYQRVNVRVAGSDREWWVRRPVEASFRFPMPMEPGQMQLRYENEDDPLELGAELLVRRHKSGWLCTAAVVNYAKIEPERLSLFQASFSVSVTANSQVVDAIVPYPDARSESLLERDEEARSLDLLYRNVPTFGVGHGCAATWKERPGELTCVRVFATALPEYEAPSVTPDIELESGETLSVPMGPLAGLDPDDDGFASIQRVADAYREWIDSLRVEAAELEGYRAQAAADHIAGCERAHQRIVAGLEWLQNDTTARRAFVLANRAILNQQLNYRQEARKTTILKSGDCRVEPATNPVPDWRTGDRRWRAFQIGFLVAAARGAVDDAHSERDTVDLIFFPTGGGKTEAYLGLAAFSLFHQRLTGRDTGVSVLMRYTLRLLTSQQFLRASALVCAMDLIREEEGLPGKRFSIGIWVGGSTTPNTREQAKQSFRSLANGKGDNPFLLLRCPWCAAQMGAVDAEKGVGAQVPKVAGYVRGASISFRCPDRSCPFSRPSNTLPVYVVDEDVYDQQPSIVIGTVDKFAMLAFRPEASTLFGIENGVRQCDPPSLIIQDELHLIGGPLGSMVGMYEPVVEELCTKEGGRPPKVVASTATIRNYAEQIRSLYGREDAALFPPHGLNADNSFFAQNAKDPETNELRQGRLYVGVHAPGLGSIQTAQVRTGAALLQAPLVLEEGQRDPWWTSLMFFNSLRELGTSVSLLQSDIPDYLYTKKLRDGSNEQRYLDYLMELTSRLRQDEIPESISKLEREVSSGNAVDVCLASNIIEVGVDIQRLSLLTVLGQPKSTSQYIQVTGRVGRKWEERPGLVVTIYSALRPRDRSHFEKFQAYHQRLYAEVEPVSVTPFSAPVLRRAAHGAAIAYVRQSGGAQAVPDPLPEEALDELERILLDRAAIADPETIPDVKEVLAKNRADWARWGVADWEDDDYPLMVRAGNWVPSELRKRSFKTPMSMRDVDAECRTEVTDRYVIAASISDTDETSHQ